MLGGECMCVVMCRCVCVSVCLCVRMCVCVCVILRGSVASSCVAR